MSRRPFALTSTGSRVLPITIVQSYTDSSAVCVWCQKCCHPGYPHCAHGSLFDRPKARRSLPRHLRVAHVPRAGSNWCLAPAISSRKRYTIAVLRNGSAMSVSNVSGPSSNRTCVRFRTHDIPTPADPLRLFCAFLGTNEHFHCLLGLIFPAPLHSPLHPLSQPAASKSGLKAADGTSNLLGGLASWTRKPLSVVMQ